MSETATQIPGYIPGTYKPTPATPASPSPSAT